MIKLFQKGINLTNEVGIIFFYLGIFLIPSTLFFGLFFLLVSLIISSFKKSENKYFGDKLNISFFIGALFLLISCSYHEFVLKNEIPYDWSSNLSWLGLANWIPFFWCFWGFAPYLINVEQRKRCALFLVSGTFPVIVSGLGQSFFDWDGPMETLWGLIIWYQRPLENITGLTGLFNNPNYAGTWLNLVWPFCLALLFQKKEKIFERISIYLFIFGISFSTFLTNSRSAWISIIVSTFFIAGKKGLKLNIFILSLLSFVLFCSLLPILGTEIQSFLNLIIPNETLMEFSNFQTSRIEIWKSSIFFIINNPLFGSGAGSFPEILNHINGFYKGHAHNLPLELIISYGLPASLFILVPVILIAFKSFRKIFLINKHFYKNQIFDKAWITALLVLIISQLVDVQYFDGRISMMGWILLSGSNNIVKKDCNNNKNTTLI